jgi:hypothetical protein
LWYRFNHPKRSYYEKKGAEGERKLKKILKAIDGKGKTLSNLYFFHKNSSTEIDMIFLHKTGLYVLESKFYQGDVFGELEDVYWIHENKDARNFYNPVRQNIKHVTEINNCLAEAKINNIPIWSVVVFSDQTKLHLQKRRLPNIFVCHQSDLRQYIRSNEKNLPEDKLLSQEKVLLLYNTLKPFTKVAAWKKHKHIKYVKRLTIQNS